jgi:hypothetical protein
MQNQTENQKKTEPDGYLLEEHETLKAIDVEIALNFFKSRGNYWDCEFVWNLICIDKEHLA